MGFNGLLRYQFRPGYRGDVNEDKGVSGRTFALDFNMCM